MLVSLTLGCKTNAWLTGQVFDYEKMWRLLQVVWPKITSISKQTGENSIESSFLPVNPQNSKSRSHGSERDMTISVSLNQSRKDFLNHSLGIRNDALFITHFETKNVLETGLSLVVFILFKTCNLLFWRHQRS